MAKKRKRSRKLPYKTIKVRRSARTGKIVAKTFRGKVKIEKAYISLLTGKRISKKTKSKSANVQGFREAFPRRSEKTRRKIKKTIREYRSLGFNPLEKSPELGRYFKWLREKRPELYYAVRKQIGNSMQEGDTINVAEIQESVEDRGPRRSRRKAKRRHR